jgi:hypothetical protein
MSSEQILNPLYAKPKGEGNKPTKHVAMARIENTRAGVCPKCMTEMSKSQLGQSMGNQTVFFCTTCRVAEPLPTV